MIIESQSFESNDKLPIHKFTELFDFVESIYKNCPYAVYVYIFNNFVIENTELETEVCQHYTYMYEKLCYTIYI